MLRLFSDISFYTYLKFGGNPEACCKSRVMFSDFSEKLQNINLKIYINSASSSMTNSGLETS